MHILLPRRLHKFGKQASVVSRVYMAIKDKEVQTHKHQQMVAIMMAAFQQYVRGGFKGVSRVSGNPFWCGLNSRRLN